MAQPKVTLQLSTGSVLNANINAATARQIVRSGDGTVITPGVTGFDVVRLISPAQDTEFQNSPNPLELLGVDDITFKPLQYPEVAKF